MMNINDFKKVAIYEFDTSIPTFSYTAATEIGKTGSYALITFGGKPYRVEIDSATGKLNWTAPEAVKDGNYSFSLVIVDRAGNHSQPGLATFVVDTTPPEAPQVLSIHDNAGNESYFQPGGTSDDKTPTLTGIAQKGSTVYLKNDKGETIGTAVADKETGKWEITPTAELQDGANSLTLVAVEKFAGAFREGVPTQPFVINVAADGDVQPGSVTIVDADDNVGNSKGSVKSGATTDDDTPTLRGTVIADQEVTIQYRQTGTSIWMTATATTSGTSWSWTPGTALAQGEWEFQAMADGNTSERFTLNINTNPDTSVTITHAVDNAGLYIGELANGALTDDITPELHGRAEANSTVYLFYRAANGGAWTVLGTATAGADGQWQATPSALTTGMVEFKATAVDNANAAGATFELTLIVSGSNVPVITGAWDDVGNYQGLIKGGYTDDTTPNVRGIAEANSRVIIEYSSGGNTYSATVQAGKNGHWDFTPPELEFGRWTFKAKTSSTGTWSKNFTVNVGEYELLQNSQTFKGHTGLSLNATNGEENSYVTDKGLKLLAKPEPGSFITVSSGTVQIGQNSHAYFEVAPSQSISLSLITNGGYHGRKVFVTLYNASGAEIDTVEYPITNSTKINYEATNGELITQFKIASNLGHNELIAIDTVEWQGLDVGMTNSFNWGDNNFSSFRGPLSTMQYDIGDRATVAANKTLTTVVSGTSEMGRSALQLDASTELEFDFRGAEEISFNLYNSNGKSNVKVDIYDIHNNFIEQVDISFDTVRKLEKFSYSPSNGELIGRVTVQPDNTVLFDNTNWKSAPAALRPQEKSIILRDNDFETQFFREIDFEGVHLSSDGRMFFNLSKYDRSGIYLNGKQDVTFTLPKEASFITLDIIALNDTSFVTFYNAAGEELGRSSNGDDHIAFSSTSGENISYFIVTNTNFSVNLDTQTKLVRLDIRYTDEQPNYVKPFAVQDESMHQLLAIDDLASHAVIGSEESIDTLKLTGKDQLLDLSAHPDYIKSVEIIDLTGTGDNTLRIDLNALLQHGEKDLFIEDGKTQMVIKGNEGDVVQLADILPEGGDISEWQHMDGTVTVAGVEYQVYSHGEDAELLVQQGVKTELI